MEFKKIQLNGFKSFADKTNFLIENGLTGIVGPNGCGKSNIVESIRWCMGETSAKSMRGSGMEDVIFSGTSNKASKNIAEVSVTVTNEKNEGPIQYRELDEVNVRRKIEKDKGSKFYINDKEVRARDAQMFFADLSTGAHSPSMISQGRIGAIVTAKPADRRAILEEAAGISGLHVRRHEAELRLNAAENNLKRADELRRQQERQLVNLQKQAEEAARYKNMSEEIKKIVNLLLEGQDLALISDAGTPTISDPGYGLIRDCIKNDISIVPIPGTSSITAAMSVSGLPSDSFTFIGFLPQKKGRLKKINQLKELDNTIILFESPYRLEKTLNQLLEHLGNRSVVVGRELTKLYEEVIRGNLNDIIVHFSKSKIKGEIVIMIGKDDDRINF